jgi:HEAT repeat protein
MTSPTDSRQVPGRLELAEWLHYGLHSPDPVDRRLALSEVVFQGQQQAFVTLLGRLAETDPEAEIRTEARRLLQPSSASPKGRVDLGKLEIAPDVVRGLLEGGEESLQRVVQHAVRRAPSPATLDQWRSHLLLEESLAVVEIGLTLLAKFGTPDDANLATTFAGSSSPAVVRAAMDLLHAQRLDRFKEEAARFLTADDLDTRLQAIRRLRTVDPAEARNFLAALLGSPDPFVRQKAQREMFLFPFREAESLYWNRLGRESRPLLLVLTGSALAMNPEPDLPLKVYDLLVPTRGLRAQILKQILQQTVAVIQASGILQVPYDEYLATLKERLEKRKIWINCQIALKDLEAPDLETRLAAIQVLRLGVGFPKVREALQRRESLEPDEELREHLAAALGKEKEEISPAGLRAKVADETFFDLPPKAQRLYLNTIARQQAFDEVQGVLPTLFSYPLERSTLLNLLTMVARFGSTLDARPLLPLLQAEDPAVLAAAIKAVGRLDLDRIATDIPRLLQHDEIRVKSAALEVYLQTDKESALGYVRGMLKTPQTAARRNGLMLLAIIDYPSAEPLLLEFFARERSSELRQQAASIIAGNATPDGMHVLFEATFSDAGTPRPDLIDLWDSACQAAIPHIGPDRAAIEQACAERRRHARETANAPPPAYALKKVAATDRQQWYTQPRTDDQGDGTDEDGLSLPLGSGWHRASHALHKAWREDKRLLIWGLVIFLPFPLTLWFLTRGSPGSFIAEMTERPAFRLPISQTGSPGADTAMPSPVANWGGGTGNFLSGFSYGAALKAQDKERQAVADDFAVKNRDTFRNELLAMSQHPEFRAYAEFYLNDHCRQGLEAISAGNLDEAKVYLTKAMLDTAVNPEARLMVCQALLGVAFETGDKLVLAKTMEVMVSLIPEGDLPQGYDKASLAQKFSDLDKMKDISPQQLQSVFQQIAVQHPQVTPQMQQHMTDGFLDMQRRFMPSFGQ